MRVKKRPFRQQKTPCKDPVKPRLASNLQKCKSEKSRKKSAICLPKRPNFGPIFGNSPAPARISRRKSLLINEIEGKRRCRARAPRPGGTSVAPGPDISRFWVRSPDFQSAFGVIVTGKPTASRRSGLLEFRAEREITGLVSAKRRGVRNVSSALVPGRTTARAADFAEDLWRKAAPWRRAYQ